MARLLQAALPLLLLASFALADMEEGTARTAGIIRFNKGDEFQDYRSIDVSKESNFTSGKFENSIEYLQSNGYHSFDNDDDRIAYLDALLVAKTCFREWVRDEECHMREFDAAVIAAEKLATKEEQEAAVQAARKADPVGAEAHDRLKDQIEDLTSIKDKSATHFESVITALKNNFNEMVEKAKHDEKQLKALKAHIASNEFLDMFNALTKADYDFAGIVEEDKRKQFLVGVAMQEWIEHERDLQQKGKLSKLDNKGWSHARWEQMMSKIPDTAKYNTRGATPVQKKHLHRELEVLGHMTAYENLKSKSGDFYMARANQLRHEAMEKSNSIIAYVMHKMQNGGSMEDMHNAMGHKSGEKDKSKYSKGNADSNRVDQLLGHRKDPKSKADHKMHVM